MTEATFLPRLHILKTLTLWMLAAAVYSVLVGVINDFVGLPHWVIGDEAAAILGLPISLLLVFRTNAAYDRWWEARKHWGQLVNDIRSMALKARAHADISEQEYREFARLLIAFPHALRSHLRGHDVLSDVPGFENDTTPSAHPPGHIAGLVHDSLDRWNRNGQLKESIWILDIHARALLDICGACERIRATPLASSFRALVRWSILMFAILGPWGIFLDSGWQELPVLLLGFGFLFGVELTAEVVEEPFGQEADDLPLEQLCLTMETFVRDTADSFPENSTGNQS